jgi:citrate synthase
MAGGLPASFGEGLLVREGPKSSAPVSEGLEGVVVSDSRICFVDGLEGRLLYWGYDIHDLADHATFEEVAYLLWHGELPTRAQLDQLNRDLVQARTLPEPVQKLMREFPRDAAPMDVLRTAVSALGLYDPDARDTSREANVRKSIRLTAQLGTVVAATGRLRAGKPPISSDPSLGHAADFLFMLWGKPADPESVRAVDIALVLHADHELNASTFSARVTAATLADMHSAITSAVGTLKGPLHGGANENVMKMLLEIDAPGNAVPAVAAMLAAKKKIAGFGHRVYKTEDPRATHLRQMSETLGRRHGQPQWFTMSREIEQYMLREKHIYANVDFYSASVYYALGIPIELFTPVFAVSRISGWTAHVLEQYADNRLIRPRAEYVGPRRRAFVPIDQRR